MDSHLRGNDTGVGIHHGNFKFIGYITLITFIEDFFKKI